jgi:O-succinylbenzoic acid--CoA ligase
MMQSARVTCDFLKIAEGSTALLCMPVDYIAGRMMIVRSMVCGLNLMTIEPKSSPEINHLPEIQFAAMVPLQVLNLLLCRKPVEKIRKLIVGGAEISSEVEGLLSNVNTEAYGTYGMAETSSHIALRRLNGSNKEDFYRKMPGVGISIDERQCLVIRAPWIPHQVITNDIVEIIKGDTFRWIGRHDNLINSGGVKIVPEEVESMVKSKTGKECIAVGLPDPKFGHRLVFAMEKDQVTGSADELKNEFASVLPRRWKPTAIFTVVSFPRNDALKIDRRKLLSILKKQMK